MAPSKVKDGNYIVIQSFMVKDLKLKGNELLTYAIIYGFSQNGEDKFTGSLQYICDWTNSTKQGIMKSLKSLVEKGLILKNEIYKNNVKFVEYQATDFTTMQQSLTGNETKFNGGSEQSLTEDMQQSLPNNIVNNLNNNIENKIVSIRFKKPTLEDIKNYCIERNNNVDPQRFYDYYESNGWKVGKNSMKDWKAAVRTWERSNSTQQNKATFDVSSKVRKNEFKQVEYNREELNF